MGQEGASAEARYDISQYGPKVEQAVQTLTEKYIELNPVSAETVSYLFGLKVEEVTQAQIDYVKHYVRAVTKHLVIGAYFGPNFDISKLSEEDKLAHLERATSGLFILSGGMFWHDITHSMVALARAEDKTKPLAVLPMYMTHTQYSSDYSSESERMRAYNHMNNDENIADMWGWRSSSTILHHIEQSPDKQTFLSRFMFGAEEHPDPVAERMLGRIYTEFKTNPRVLLDIFIEETREYMRANTKGVNPTLQQLAKEAKKK